MDRYQTMEKLREEIQINENDIRITTQGRMRSYISYATSLLQQHKGPSSTLLTWHGPIAQWWTWHNRSVMPIIYGGLFHFKQHIARYQRENGFVHQLSDSCSSTIPDLKLSSWLASWIRGFVGNYEVSISTRTQGKVHVGSNFTDFI